MKKSWFAVIVIFLCCAIGAFAQDVFTLTGVTAGGPNLGGVYTSPYTATISGVGSGIDVICDDYTDDVYFNESWYASATNLSTLSTSGVGDTNLMWNPNGTAYTQALDYVTVAILTSELESINPDTTQGEDLSFAIWDVFDPGASSGLADNGTITGEETAASTLAAKDLAGNTVAGALSLNNISNVTIYTPDPDAKSAVISCPAGDTCGRPQEYMTVSMAEPPSRATLGMDLLGVAGLILFARRRSIYSVKLSRS